MRKAKSAIIILLCLVFGYLGNALATPYTYKMGGESWIDTSGTVRFLEMQAIVNPDLDDIMFSLNAGQSKAFKFARIWTSETWINRDDVQLGHVTAYLDFDLPDWIVNVDGTSVGFSGCFQFNQGWKLTWNDPVLIDFGNGGRFKLELEDAMYLSNWWQGPDGGDCIKAKVTHLATPVPEPASFLLLGIGCFGLAGLRRKIKRKKH